MAAMTPEERMARAEELAAEHENLHEAMSGGEWYREVGLRVLNGTPSKSSEDEYDGLVADAYTEADCEGIAHLRNAAPDVAAVLRGLVADLRAARAKVATLEAEIARMAPVVAAADAWRDAPCKGLGSHREAALADAVDAWRKGGAERPVKP